MNEKPYSVKPWPSGEQTEVVNSDGQEVYTTDHESALMVRDLLNCAYAQGRASAAPKEGEVEMLRAALEGVIRVADRKTIEFDFARAVLRGECAGVSSPSEHGAGDAVSSQGAVTTAGKPMTSLPQGPDSSPASALSPASEGGK